MKQRSTTCSHLLVQTRILDFKGMWAGEGCAVPTVHEFWDGEVATPKDY
jgi:hypothetical protein